MQVPQDTLPPPVRKQSSTASTCFADFLVLKYCFFFDICQAADRDERVLGPVSPPVVNPDSVTVVAGSFGNNFNSAPGTLFTPPVRKQSSTASTCYADFLVLKYCFFFDICQAADRDERVLGPVSPPVVNPDSVTVVAGSFGNNFNSAPGTLFEILQRCQNFQKINFCTFVNFKRTFC